MTQERIRTFLLSTFSSYATTIVSIFVGLLTVPIGLHYFGPVRYGIWAVISSVIAYLSISNLGITTAVQALTPKASEPFEKKAILQRSLSLLLIISLVVLIIVLGLAYLYPGWVSILGRIPVNLQREATEATITMVILFLLNLPLTVFSAAFVGCQKVYWEQFYLALTQTAGLAALILTVFLLKGDLVTLALLRGIATLFVSFVRASHFLFTHYEFCQKFDTKVRKEFSTKSIFTSGVRFFSIGIAAMVVWSTDNLVISHFIGPNAVTPYSVAFGIFTIGYSTFTAVNGVLWPMYGHSAGKNQWEWIQQIYDYTVYLLPIIGGLLWIGGIAFAKEIINVWVGPDAYGGILLIIALGGYGYTLSMVNSHATILNALNLTKNVVVLGWLEAAFNLGMSLALIKTLGIGGVALGTFLASLMTVFWLLPLDIRHQTAGKVKLQKKPIIKHAVWVMLPCLTLVLLTFLYVHIPLIKFMVNIFIITIYLALSWCIMPPNVRNLAKNALRNSRPNESSSCQKIDANT
jgi:O-antigen/teichoic acid export membrane protein